MGLSAAERDELARLSASLDELERRVKSRSPASYVPHEPHEKQRAFLALDVLEALYGGGVGGGKSDALLMDALQGVGVPGYSAILFRRTHSDLALPGALLDRSHEWLANTAAHWDGTHKQWRFPSGAVLSFGYMDAPRAHLRYQSAEFQFVGFDELSQFPESQYRFMFSRLRKRETVKCALKMRGATNPGDIGHVWIKKRWDIPDTIDFARVYAHEGRVFVPARLEDNGHVSRDEYEAALAELDSATFDALRRGRWIQQGGVIYPIDDRLVIDEMPAIDGLLYFLGIDFGTSSTTPTTALIVLAVHPRIHGAWVAESHVSAGGTPSSIARKIRELMTRYSFTRIVADQGGLGGGYIREFVEEHNLPVEPVEKSVKLAFRRLLRGALEDGRVHVVGPLNRELLAEAAALAWNAAGTDAVAGQPDHLTDAMLYAWRAARSHLAVAPETHPVNDEERLEKKRLALLASLDEQYRATQPAPWED